MSRIDSLVMHIRPTPDQVVVIRPERRHRNASSLLDGHAVLGGNISDLDPLLNGLIVPRSQDPGGSNSSTKEIYCARDVGVLIHGLDANTRKTSMQEIPAMTQENLVVNLARMDSIHTRIKALREALDLSMEQVGTAVGVSWQTVQQWENGKTAPKRLRLEAVAKALRTNPDHLLFGEKRNSIPKDIDDLESAPGLIAIRKVDFKISAGIAGFSVDFLDNGEGTPIFLPKSWADAKRIDPTKLYATRISGQSMEPGMQDSDVVVVDTGNVKKEKNAVFALNHAGEFTVKRLRYEHRKWWLASDNPSQADYPPVECDGDTHIIGRIVHLYRDI